MAFVFYERIGTYSKMKKKLMIYTFIQLSSDVLSTEITFSSRYLTWILEMDWYAK